MRVTDSEQNRVGDHLWSISDISAFLADHPNFTLAYDIEAMLANIHDRGRGRWLRSE